ncbi:MAG: hypothetical protein CMH60_05590 [Myxococcales bacterium]|nr:hypothetical protein [Myxococcales bacterium]
MHTFKSKLIYFCILSQLLLSCDSFSLEQLSITLSDPQSLSEGYSQIRVRLRSQNERIEYYSAEQCDLSEKCTLNVQISKTDQTINKIWVETLDENDVVLARSYNALDKVGDIEAELTNPCSNSADCDDGNACTGVDACTFEICIVSEVPQQNDICATENNTLGHCIDAECQESQCGDGILCNVESCNTGPNNSLEECDDGNTTNGDGCENDCSYTLVICSLGAEQIGKACDDGNGCTTNDVCLEDGTCAGAARDCNTPPNSCYASEGTCEAGDCAYDFLADEECDDNDACTGTDAEPDRCVLDCNADNECSGSCVGGGQITCDSPPGDGACFVEPATCSAGQCNYIAKAAGTDCSNGNLCDGAEECNTEGLCVALSGTEYACDAPPSICHTSVGATCAMNGAEAECTYPAKTNDTPCDNDSLCDGREICTDGTCAASEGSAVDCPSERPTCDTSTGACTCTSTSCNDGLFCNGTEICNEIGLCEREPLNSCTNGSGDACLPSGCVNPNCNSALDMDFFGECNETTDTCDYNSAETICENQCGVQTANQCPNADPCDSKECDTVPEIAPFANECWQVMSDPQSRCSNGNCIFTFLENTACDDGNICTENSKCICLDTDGEHTACPSTTDATGIIYTCGLGDNIECDDDNVCTFDYCDMEASDTTSRCVNTELPAGAAGLCPADEDPCTEEVCDGAGSCTTESPNPDCGE